MSEFLNRLDDEIKVLKIKYKEQNDLSIKNEIERLENRKRVYMRLDERIRILKNCYRGQNDWRSARNEIQRRGGEWVAENGMTFRLIDNAIYAITSEAGVRQILVSDYAAEIPYIAVLEYDLQFVSPENLRNMIEELNQRAQIQARERPRTEIIVIVKKDWLSKISLRRWGTIHWQYHLKPTTATLNAPKRRGRPFNPDLIYPGDTFEVIH